MQLLRFLVLLLCSILPLAAGEEQVVQYGLLTAKVPKSWTRQDVPHGGVQYVSPNPKGEGPMTLGPVLLLKSVFVGDNTIKDLKAMSDKMMQSRQAQIDKALESDAGKEKAADFAALFKQSKVEVSTRNGVECLMTVFVDNVDLGVGRIKARTSTITFVRNRQTHIASLTVPLESLTGGEKEFQAILESIAIAPEQK